MTGKEGDNWREVDVTLKRPFNWGLLVVCDIKSDETGPVNDPVNATPTAIFILVRHAQDIALTAEDPAEVTITIQAGPADDVALTYEGIIQLPTGVLSVGDADDELPLNLGAGNYLMQIRLDKPDFAETVNIWVSPER